MPPPQPTPVAPFRLALGPAGGQPEAAIPTDRDVEPEPYGTGFDATLFLIVGFMKGHVDGGPGPRVQGLGVRYEAVLLSQRIRIPVSNHRMPDDVVQK
jgi:hypothetical protein